MQMNRERWVEGKASPGGPRPSDYRRFTAASAKIWHGLSNAEQAVHDRTVAHSGWCLERARRSRLSDAEKAQEDCTKCTERCAEAETPQPQKETHTAAEPRPLAPFFVFQKQHRDSVTGNPIQRAKELGRLWRELSDDSKARYLTTEFAEWKSRSRAKARGYLGKRLSKKG
jgi:hypothetical protein